MNNQVLLASALATSLLGNSIIASAQTTTENSPIAKSTSTTTTTVKPASQPGWVIVEEWVLWPLHRETNRFLTDTSAAHRRGDEKKAAEELGKAIAWMKVTDAHATVEGRYQLVQARERLEKIQKDLAAGSLVDADTLSKGIASAYYSIANEHYLKAKEHRVGSAGNEDSNESAKHMIAAGLYLQDAARSAEHEFGKDIANSLKVIDAQNLEQLDIKETRDNFLADNLKHIGDGLQQLGAELQLP